MEWSDAWSESIQTVDIQTGNEKARWNGQKHGQSQINKFTYKLKMRKQEGMVRFMDRSNQQVNIHPRNENTGQNGQRHSQIVKPTNSHTSWK